MKNIRFEEFCRQFFSVTFIPITYVNTEKTIFCTYPEGLNELNPLTPKLVEMFHLQKNPDYYITQSFCYFGVVMPEQSEGFLLVGPVFSTPVSDEAVRSFMSEFSIPKQHQEKITAFLTSSPCISFNHFLNILSFIHLNVNNKVLDIVKHFKISETSVQKKVSENHSRNLYSAKEEQVFHNSFQFEQQYLSHVQNGETEKLKMLLTDAASIPQQGIVADNMLRQAKNIFIAIITLTTRASIAGGLDAEQAYYLSDNYIQEMEKLRRTDDINSLQYTILIDFTERVAGRKIPAGMSREVFSCIQYISQHTNEPIQVNDVAEHVNMSRSTITRRFKKELGFDISSFIRRCKLEEARSLLTFTDKSLSEISSYLCFSSQSHFQTAFKAKYGVTPLQYRNSNMKQ